MSCICDIKISLVQLHNIIHYARQTRITRTRRFGIVNTWQNNDQYAKQPILHAQNVRSNIIYLVHSCGMYCIEKCALTSKYNILFKLCYNR